MDTNRLVYHNQYVYFLTICGEHGGIASGHDPGGSVHPTGFDTREVLQAGDGVGESEESTRGQMRPGLLDLGVPCDERYGRLAAPPGKGFAVECRRL